MSRISSELAATKGERDCATVGQIDHAREVAHDFHNDDHNSLEIDDDAELSEAGDGTGHWIQAWLWIPTDEEIE